MRKPSKSVAKRTKLEPLSVEEALSAPAVKGMLSFLNIRPEELLHYRQLSDVVRRATPLPPNPDTPRTINDLNDEAIISSPGIEVNPGPGLELNSSSKLRSDSSPELDSVPGADLNPNPGVETNHDPGIESHSTPGIELNSGPGPELDSRPATTTLRYRKTSVQSADDKDLDAHALPISNSGHPGISYPGLEFNVNPGQELTVNRGEELNCSPGLELHSSDSERSLLVSQVRYTIRRARLVQDGHTSNEQKLYEYLWTHGNAYDDVSRRLSIGFRTLAEKVRMARASAQKTYVRLGKSSLLRLSKDLMSHLQKRLPTVCLTTARSSDGVKWQESLVCRRTQAVRFVDGKGQEIIRPLVPTPALVLDNSPGLAFDSSPGLYLSQRQGLTL